MLAVTMALEHFTAGFASQYLGNPNVTRGADPNVVALWAWHAAEEAEHKSTCFDIYERLGGTYGLRVGVALPCWIMLLAIAFRNLFGMLRHDGQLGNVRDLARGFRFLFGFRGLVTRMVPGFLAYFRPGFHPWRKNDSHLVRDWQSANARYITNLRP